MDFWTGMITLISGYTIIGTIAGCVLIAIYLYLKYVRKKEAKKLLAIGMILIGITVLIFAFFFYFGFIQGGLAQN
ncbi:hypothetical protein AALC75_27010 [Lachnospiraceae bacterium 48-42]